MGFAKSNCLGTHVGGMDIYVATRGSDSSASSLGPLIPSPPTHARSVEHFLFSDAEFDYIENRGYLKRHMSVGPPDGSVTVANGPKLVQGHLYTGL